METNYIYYYKYVSLFYLKFPTLSKIDENQLCETRCVNVASVKPKETMTICHIKIDMQLEYTGLAWKELNLASVWLKSKIQKQQLGL